MFISLMNIVTKSYPTWLKIGAIIGTIMTITGYHKDIYKIIGLFFTRKFKPAKKKHKYGIVIAARNEKLVIGNLLDSINKQDYPSDLLTVFVVADNCTDNTADIARDKGAIVYERFDQEHKTKGFALQYLFKNIEKDYGTNSFEGYFVFDADNLLKKDYISKMNDAFDAGCKLITSYRNTKNFDENWIASNYALHWIRSSRTNHRARSVLHLATNIQGTGFLFSNEIVSNGWNYTSLTEDRALTADAVAQGYEISYQDEAEFFDEQPVSLKVALRQRLRWSKGHLQAFVETGPYLFLNIFLGKKYIKTRWKKDVKKENSFWKRLVESIRHRWASYDTLVQLTPMSFIGFCKWLLISVLLYMFVLYDKGVNAYLFGGSSWLVKLLRNLCGKKIILGPGVGSMIIGALLVILSRILYRVSNYFKNTLLAIYLFFIDRKRIKKMSIWKKIWFIFMWPWFDIIGRYTTYVAVFKKVEWKPIPHESKVTIDDLNKE